MKVLFASVLIAVSIIGFTGNAIAMYELGNVQVIVYEGGASAAGVEYHVDIGDSSPYADGTHTCYTLDTGIRIDDFTYAQDWSDLSVGIIGGFDLDYTTWQYNDGVFGSTGDSSVNSVTGFSTASIAMSYIANIGFGPIEKTADGLNTYFKTFNFSGDALGTYANLLSTTGNEAQLGVDTSMDIFAFDATTYTAYQISTIGFDISGNTLVLTCGWMDEPEPIPDPIPIPGAIYLLGTGLLGLTGIRRKKEK